MDSVFGSVDDEPHQPAQDNAHSLARTFASDIPASTWSLAPPSSSDVEATLAAHEQRINNLEWRVLFKGSESTASTTLAPTPTSASTTMLTPATAVAATTLHTMAPSSTNSSRATSAGSAASAGAWASALASAPAVVCPLGCRNRTGFDAKASSADVARHAKSRYHVEAALGLATAAGLSGALLFCACTSATPAAAAIELPSALGVRNDMIASLFTSVARQMMCCNKACMRLRQPAASADADALRQARQQAATILSGILNEDGKRKRRRDYVARVTRVVRSSNDDDDDSDDDSDNNSRNKHNNERNDVGVSNSYIDADAHTHKNNNNNNNFDDAAGAGSADVYGESEVRGDQTVAIEFAANTRFATPGVCYLLLDHERGQLRVQQERPTTGGGAHFHVAHVARMHRWHERVVHFAPSRHELWRSHVAVADHGFVDAFVLVHAGIVLPRTLDADARHALFERIACDEWLLCAGRSDGWLELIRRDDLDAAGATLAHLLPLPLSHLQPHAVRLYDARARPSLMLMSSAESVPIRQDRPFDVHMQVLQAVCAFVYICCD